MIRIAVGLLGLWLGIGCLIAATDVGKVAESLTSSGSIAERFNLLSGVFPEWYYSHLLFGFVVLWLVIFGLKSFSGKKDY